METILGIDLGTTNSVVAAIRNGAVEVLREEGETLLPSVVGLDADGKLLVGAPALNQWVLAPDRTVRSIKRKMGESDPVRLGDQEFAPQEVSAIILRTLKERAERILGHGVEKAVITVPAFFNETQREATKEAGTLAGLEVVRIVNEPTAASLGYEADAERMEQLLVYDLGGGTFDVSIVQIEEGVVEVLSSHGDTHLGGDDFDRLLLDHVCADFMERHGVDLCATPSAKTRVLRAAEQAKKDLSFEPFAKIEEEFIAEKDGVPLHLDVELARTDYEDLIESLALKTLVCVDEALSDAKLPANRIDKVVLVGGASRTPLVHRLLEERLGLPLHAEVDPDLCVAIGATVQAGLIAGCDVGPVLVDVTPHTLGIQVLGTLEGQYSDRLFSRIIERNTPLPASRTEVYYTSYDGQQEVAIDVFQGEDDDVGHNMPVGAFMLEGLAEKALSGNNVVVRFDLDLDGILKVTARERDTGLEKQLVIENAIEQFRREDHEQAKSRLDAAFATRDDGLSPDAVGAPVDSAATVGDESAPDELGLSIAKAEALIEKGRKAAPEASAEDMKEIEDIIDRLRNAIADRSRERIEAVCLELEDLVFYLQDA